mgnify:CR=1 FL=1
MKQLFLFFLLFLFSATAAFATGEGTYGNETYGNFSYGVSSSASSSFSNSSVSVPANTPTIINSTSTNAVVELNTKSDVAGAVTLVKYDSKPPAVGTNTFTAMNKYLDVVVDSSISNQLNYSIIKMFYTDADVSASNLDESTIRLSKWNGSEWIKFDPPTGGVDITNNFVWANTSSFSTWGIFGTTVPAPSPAPSGGGPTGGGGGGGGGGNWGWECSAWSECSSSGTQSRTCNLVPGGSLSTKPAESQTCTYTAPTPITEEAPTPAAPATPAPAVTPSAPTAPITGAAVAPPTGFGKLTGALISDLKKPGTWIGIIVAVLVIGALYAGYYYLYKRK